MSLVTFTPLVCQNSILEGCENLVGYARISQAAEVKLDAIYQFTTTVFTCIILASAFIIFSNDTEVIVIKPIKKVVEII